MLPPTALHHPSWITATITESLIAAATGTSVLDNGKHHAGGDGGSGGGDNSGSEPLKNWSSLIGIITAIVGNVLIAMALNVQRYAHTRLHKERISIRRRARAAMKRSQAENNSTGSYGTVIRNGNSNGNSSAEHDYFTRNDSAETDPLTASFLSSADTEDRDEEAERQAKAASSYLKSPYWWLGQILITLGEMGNFLAYGFAPASIVSPLGVVALISNCLIAPLMFHERFRPRDFWGVVIAVGGVVTVVLSANTQEGKLEPHDVWDAITTVEFEVYLGVTWLLIFVLMWASPRYGKRTILIDLGLVGLFGGYTALATKGVSSMLSSTLWRAFTTPVTYVLVFILLGTAIMQIRYVNKALQRFDSTQVIPIQFVMFTLCVILGSAILYRDFENTTGEQAGKFVGGCFLTFFGVFLITSGRDHHDLDDEDALSEADGVEETIGLANHEGYQQNQADESATPSVSRSRRSSRHSRIAFSGVTVPEARDENDEDVPSIRYTDDGDVPTPLNPNSSTSLLTTPLRPGFEATTPPGRGIRTLSADTFMRGSAVITPGRSNPVTPVRDSLAPPGYPADQVVMPQNRASTFGPSGHHRSGSTFISPSPLSSTVTTVMKDGFLRDKPTLPSKSSMRHLRSRIRASLFFNEDEDGNITGPAGVPASDDNLARVQTYQDTPRYQDYPSDIDGDTEGGRVRSRSFSDTLGDFFKPKRRKRRDDIATPDVEAEGHETDTPGLSR